MSEIRMWTHSRLVFGGIRIAACLLWVGLGAGPSQAQGAQDEVTQNGVPTGEAPVLGDSIELKSALRETQDSASELAPILRDLHQRTILRQRRMALGLFSGGLGVAIVANTVMSDTGGLLWMPMSLVGVAGMVKGGLVFRAAEFHPSVVEVEHHLSSVVDGDVQEAAEFLEEKALARQISDPLPVSFRLGGCVGLDPSCYGWALQAEVEVARAGLSVSARPGIDATGFVAGELKIVFWERQTRRMVTRKMVARHYLYGGTGLAFDHVTGSRNPRIPANSQSRPPQVSVDEWVSDTRIVGGGLGTEYQQGRSSVRLQVGVMSFDYFVVPSIGISQFWTLGSR